MSHIVLNYAPTAETDILRIVHFYKENRDVAKLAITRIRKVIKLLATTPDIGTVVDVEQFQHLNYAREVYVKFGRSGYVVLYEHVPKSNIVTIVAIRSYREAGYSFEPVPIFEDEENDE